MEGVPEPARVPNGKTSWHVRAGCSEAGHQPQLLASADAHGPGPWVRAPAASRARRVGGVPGQRLRVAGAGRADRAAWATRDPGEAGRSAGVATDGAPQARPSGEARGGGRGAGPHGDQAGLRVRTGSPAPAPEARRRRRGGPRRPEVGPSRPEDGPRRLSPPGAARPEGGGGASSREAGMGRRPPRQTDAPGGRQRGRGGTGGSVRCSSAPVTGVPGRAR